MKKIFSFALLSFFWGGLSKLNAQSSCPQIVNSTFHILVDNLNPCLKNIAFDFINPTNGNKHIKVIVTVNNVEVINTCVDASGQSGVQRTYTSSQFSVCNLSDLVVSITPITGNCGGGGCAPTIISIGGAPLPVTFSSFTAVRNHSDVVLRWETVTEQNNRGFAIERNTSGVWQHVAMVASQSSDGNSNNRLDYQYSDFNNTKGISQYRIRQIDFDVNSKYSDIRVIHGEDQVGETMVYPNPSFDGKINLLFKNTSTTREIAVTDMAGRMVRQWRNFSGNALQIEALTPGMYSIRTIDDQTGETAVEKMVVNNR